MRIPPKGVLLTVACVGVFVLLHGQGQRTRANAVLASPRSSAVSFEPSTLTVQLLYVRPDLRVANDGNGLVLRLSAKQLDDWPCLKGERVWRKMTWVVVQVTNCSTEPLMVSQMSLAQVLMHESTMHDSHGQPWRLREMVVGGASDPRPSVFDLLCDAHATHTFTMYLGESVLEPDVNATPLLPRSNVTRLSWSLRPTATVQAIRVCSNRSDSSSEVRVGGSCDTVVDYVGNSLGEVGK